MPPALLELADSLAGLPGALEAAGSLLSESEPGAVTVPRLRLFPGLMAATYGPGSYYVPHLDKYSGGSSGFENSRLLTLICYLNDDWQPGDGGELRLFASKDAEGKGSPGSRIPELLGISADHSESTSSMAHDAERNVDIPPLMGRVVMFRSRDVWHGIQELSYARWAVTLWLLADTT
ncbi:unnamed protein product [Polarella glacialis]|uniref:Fe2OG dioxygenase domain-containing protein n=2 Tax=Polarella glacialis TaxID=89957 RepID=A0A813JCR7_POLGL|nr:unnamed protein product [Polarella glacialis]